MIKKTEKQKEKEESVQELKEKRLKLLEKFLISTDEVINSAKEIRKMRDEE